MGQRVKHLHTTTPTDNTTTHSSLKLQFLIKIHILATQTNPCRTIKTSKKQAAFLHQLIQLKMQRLRRPLSNHELESYWHNCRALWQHTCGLHGNKSSIDPKKHFMCSEGWQPSSFSKEPALSLLHSSRASRSAWWIMSSVSSKTRLVPDRYTTRYRYGFHRLQISAGTDASTSDWIELSVHDEGSQASWNLQLFASMKPRAPPQEDLFMRRHQKSGVW